MGEDPYISVLQIVSSEYSQKYTYTQPISTLQQHVFLDMLQFTYYVQDYKI